jgi:hypothetical protein
MRPSADPKDDVARRDGGASGGARVMVKVGPRAGPQETPRPPNFPFGDLAVLGAKRVDECLSAQAELVKTVEGINRRWLGRMKSETALASDFAEHLAAARTFPDVMAACRQWTSRRLELMAEEGRHILDALTRVSKPPAVPRAR